MLTRPAESLRDVHSTQRQVSCGIREAKELGKSWCERGGGMP